MHKNADKRIEKADREEKKIFAIEALIRYTYKLWHQIILTGDIFCCYKRQAKERHKRGTIMETIILRDEYIKLGQALKAAGLVESGVEAKEVIQEGLVMVNGETDTRRGRKLYGGDIVLFDGEEIRIEG